MFGKKQIEKKEEQMLEQSCVSIRKRSILYNVCTVITLTALFFCAVRIFLISDVNEKKNETAVTSEFEVSPIFCDNMVLQQNEEIRVWGTSKSEGETISARLGDSYGSTVVKNSEWEITFAPRVYSSEPLVLEIYGGKENEYVSFENLRVGDVWWVAGQSNIEFSSSASSSWTEFTSTLTGNENVYIYEISESSFSKPTYDRWRRLNEYSAAPSSALACFTYKKINDSVNNEIPIGVIITGYSGAELASFMPKELTSDAAFALEKSKIYNDILSYTVKIPVRGMVWYQGEADASIYSAYSEKLSAYIKWLREEKNQANRDFPVYAVELTPCFNDSKDPLRQYIDYGGVRGETGFLCAELKNFYLCPTSDLWNDRSYSNSLHPDNKMQISERLSAMILSRDYQYGNCDMYFGPQLKEYTITPDEKCVTLTFDQPITAKKLSGFLIIGDEWKEIPDAEIEIAAPDKIVIKSSTEIKMVRYNTDTDNVFGEDIFLCNGQKIPVGAFSVTFQKLDDDRKDVDKIINVPIGYKHLMILAVGILLILIVIKARKK